MLDFGSWVSVSGNGSTLAVGAPGESSADGTQTSNTATSSGAVYVYTRPGTSWQHEAYLKASNPGAGDEFFACSLTADGNTLVVGAAGESSSAVGIDGNAMDNSAMKSGAAYLFRRTGTVWSQTAYIKATNTDAGDRVGDGLVISSDGTTLVVGAVQEDSAATLVGGDEGNNGGIDSAYVFELLTP